YAGPAESHPPYAKMRIVAHDVADEVMRAYQDIEYRDWVPLRAASSELNLRVRKPDAEMKEWVKMAMNRPENEKPPHSLEKTYAERVILIEVEWPDNIDVVMQSFGIGDLGVAAIPFEVFTQIGLDIKEKSPFSSTFTIELANGSYGYLPTPEQHLLGGYETWLGTNRVEYEASNKIIAELLNLFQKIKK